jgi:hypothetical protein
MCKWRCKFIHHLKPNWNGSSIVPTSEVHASIIFSLPIDDVYCLFSWRYNPLWLYFPQPGSGLQPPRFRGFLITHNDEPQSVGLLWTSDQSVAETSTWQHTTLTTDKHPCPGGILTHDLSRRAAEDLRLRPHDHWDRPLPIDTNHNYGKIAYNGTTSTPNFQKKKKRSVVARVEMLGHMITKSTVNAHSHCVSWERNFG